MVTKPSRSSFVDLRGVRYHLREWGSSAGTRSSAPLVLLHGWMDVSASFQFMVDALCQDRHVVAPDWRGFGLTGRAGGDSYWFPDYLADLDRMLEALSPGQPVDLAGHSMGGNVACLYAGVRPHRVRRLVNLEGFGLAEQPPQAAVARYGRWLDEVAAEQRFRDYPDFDALAARLVRDNPRLSPVRARFLAEHWARQGADGRVELLCDPSHRRVNPVRYRVDEAFACWQAIEAPVLWVEGADSATAGQLRLDAAELAVRRAQFRNLRYEVIGDCGHMIHLDQPERLAALIEAFLATA